MFGKVETIALLDQAGITYELYEHEAVFTVEQAHAAGIPHQELGAKNLFLRDDKHRAYYLVCLPDEKDVSLQEIQGHLGSRRLSFASEKDLCSMLGLVPGSVTPLGALNDVERRVEVVIDQELVDAGRVTVHPCDNTATVLLAMKDLIGLLREHGCTVRVVDLSPFARRRLTDEDLPALLDLCESNPAYYELYGERPTLENLAQALRELPPGCDADQKEFLGFFEEGLVAVMDVIRGYPDERAAYVGLLMVDGARHGHGIGTQVARAEFRRLRFEGFSRVRLAYIQGNEPARHFWTSLGFEPAGAPVSTPHYVAVPMERAI